MASNIIWIYFSYTYDKDLIAFYQNVPKKVFTKAVRESLRLLIRPGYESEFFRKLSLDSSWEAVNTGRMAVDLSLCSAKDEDIRIFLDNAKDKRKGELIKKALRCALGTGYVIGNCLKGDETLNKNKGNDCIFFVKAPKEKKIYVSSNKDNPKVKDIPKKTDKTSENVSSEVILGEDDTDNIPSFGMSAPSFSLPGLSSEPDKQDEFSDEDILSMLDNM